MAKFPALSLYMSEARVMPHIRVANPANRTSVGAANPTELHRGADAPDGRMPTDPDRGSRVWLIATGAANNRALEGVIPSFDPIPTKPSLGLGDTDTDARSKCLDVPDDGGPGNQSRLGAAGDRRTDDPP